jgi:putative serine protease PepD
LVNDKGQLIGINVAIASAGSSSASGSIGVGFAIPSSVAKRIADQIVKGGTASHGLLGAQVKDAVASDSAASFTTGAQVVETTAGGAAQKFGVKAGDIITSLNGDPITSASELTAAVRQQPAGSKVTLELTRDGETKTIQVTLGDASDLK